MSREHDAKREALELRLLAKCVVVESCWEWGGATAWGGYGHAWHNGKSSRAHRLMYELKRGPVPAGLVLDHLCRNRLCINPDHLEAVTEQVNIRRGTSPAALHAAKTHCKNGHPLTAGNVYVNTSTRNRRPRRQCRACVLAYQSRRNRELADALKREEGKR